MGYQPKHWLVTKLGGTKPEGEIGMQSVTVIADTYEEAIAQGESWLKVPGRLLTAERFTSGAAVYDPRDRA